MEVGVIINSIGICWLIYHYNDFIDEFNFILKNFKRILFIPKTILNCFKCLSFWTSYIITGDIAISGFISLICYIIDKYLLDTNIKL